jgi:Tfp pilus assembly protein PilN
MSAKVAELDTMQERIRKYRPWFDDSFPNLAVLRQLSASFPQDGSVTATSIEIREGSNVTCAGTARDTAAFLRMLETLNAAPGVIQLHRDQIRGTSPIQFTFGFQWNPGATP